MREHGVMFSMPMVQAILAGRKTQTRRLATSPLRRVEAGHRIWVRETFIEGKGVGGYAPGVDPDVQWDGPTVDVIFRADDGENERLAGPWSPAIHMPRRLSRILLAVSEVRFQPLHAITDDDAIAEGIVEHETCGWHVPGIAHPNKDFPILSRPTPREMYGALWDCLHGSGAWLADPHVVAITFERVE